ncbi:MAG: hypothetical protein LH609_05630, partial [Rudanella sp.]|nr:hypothetical protein [Rudanella sp.]
PTRFQCTLSGTTPPDAIQITITNLKGQLVRTVGLPGHIGTNEWVWNGTDDGGDALPAGLYLYHFQLTGLNASAFMLRSVASLTGRILLIR